MLESEMVCLLLKKLLKNMEDENDVRVIRKDRKQGRTGLAHGGVAVFYDFTKGTFKNFPLNALKGPEVRDYEILPVRGNLRGIKREVVVF